MFLSISTSIDNFQHCPFLHFLETWNFFIWNGSLKWSKTRKSSIQQSHLNYRGNKMLTSIIFLVWWYCVPFYTSNIPKIPKNILGIKDFGMFPIHITLPLRMPCQVIVAPFISLHFTLLINEVHQYLFILFLPLGTFPLINKKGSPYFSLNPPPITLS